MEKYIKSALRAANLQRLLIHSDLSTDEELRLYVLDEAFKQAFEMGEHLYYKLRATFEDNVAKWLRSLDNENERLFFESDHFNFLN